MTRLCFGSMRPTSALVALTLACSDGVEPTPIVPCGDDQEVEVLVSADKTPVFTWSPACGMASLEVRPTTGSGGSTWLLFTGPRAAENPLRSGIRYGEAPPEALEPGPATELMPDTEYAVVVSRWVDFGEPGGGGSLLPQGEATFHR